MTWLGIRLTNSHSKGCFTNWTTWTKCDKILICVNSYYFIFLGTQFIWSVKPYFLWKQTVLIKCEAFFYLKKKKKKKNDNKLDERWREWMSPLLPICFVDSLFWSNAMCISKSRVCNSSNKIWSEFCNLYAHAQPIFLLCCKFQTIVLKTVRDDTETQTLLCYVYMAIFVSKSRVCNSSKKIWSEFYDLYAHAQPIFLLYCNSKSSSWKL